MHKIIALAFVIGLGLSEYFVINDPQTYLITTPPKAGSAWRLWRRPIRYILNSRIFQQLLSWFTGRARKVTENGINLTTVDDIQGNSPIGFSEQSEEDKRSNPPADLDDYLNDPETFMATMLLFICGLLIELGVIGYFFIYPIYLDRYSDKKDKTRRRKNPRRIKKVRKKPKRTNKITF